MLVLFDIDGTLLQGAHQVHREALHAALHEVHGVDVSRAGRVEAAGRTDGAIARDILLAAGISATRIDERSDAVRDVTCREYARRCPRTCRASSRRACRSCSRACPVPRDPSWRW